MLDKLAWLGCGYIVVDVGLGIGDAAAWTAPGDDDAHCDNVLGCWWICGSAFCWVLVSVFLSDWPLIVNFLCRIPVLVLGLCFLTNVKNGENPWACRSIYNVNLKVDKGKFVNDYCCTSIDSRIRILHSLMPLDMGWSPGDAADSFTVHTVEEILVIYTFFCTSMNSQI